MDERGLVERVDSLTAAVADLSFKLDTLISSTTAFRESFGERMTDYADLVAHWSIETEQNLADQRRTVDRALAAQAEAVDRLSEAIAKSERRTLDAIEAVAGRLADEPGSADALAAVLAEVAAVRREMGALPREAAVDLGPITEELAQLRLALSEADVEDVEDEVSFAAALGEQLAALREAVDALSTRELPEAFTAIKAAVRKNKTGDDLAEMVAGLQAEVRGLTAKGFDGELADAVHALRTDVAALQQQVATAPAVPPEVTALTDALRALRSELEHEPADVTVEADDRLEETLAELVFEVRALRRRLAPEEAPRRRRRPPPDPETD